MSSFLKYINNLPKALAEKEQERLIQEYYKTRDEAIREKLISHNLRLVWAVVKTFYGVYRDLDDLMTKGTIELINVIDNLYDINKGVKLSTYAWDRIYRKVYYEVNRGRILHDAIYRTSSFAKPYNPEDLPKEDLQDENDYALVKNRWVAEDGDFRLDVEADDFIEGFFNSLDDERYRYVAIHTFGFYGEKILTQREIAKELKLSTTTVSLLQNRIKTAIKDFYLNKDKGQTYDDELQSVIDYINSTDNEKHKEILEYYYGINGKEKMTGADVARLFGYNPSTYMNTLLKNLRARGCIEDECPEFPLEEIQCYLDNCSNIDEINILEYYYGLNGKPKLSICKMVKELGLTNFIITKTLNKILKKIEVLHSHGFTSADIIKLEAFSNSLINKWHKGILNHTFMLNGRKYISSEKLSEKIGISEDRIYSILDRLKEGYKEFIAEEKQPK